MGVIGERRQRRRYRRRIRYWTNVQRARHGVAPVFRNAIIEVYAQRWANKLDAMEAFYHSEVGDLLQQMESGWASENLERFPLGYTPRQVVQAWMDSEGHRKNLLNPKARRMGIGAAWDVELNGWVMAQCFTD